jgi:hypothetical protein
LDVSSVPQREGGKTFGSISPDLGHADSRIRSELVGTVVRNIYLDQQIGRRVDRQIDVPDVPHASVGIQIVRFIGLERALFRSECRGADICECDRPFETHDRQHFGDEIGEEFVRRSRRPDFEDLSVVRESGVIVVAKAHDQRLIGFP